MGTAGLRAGGSRRGADAQTTPPLGTAGPRQKPAGFAGLSANPFFAAFANQLIDIIEQLAREQVTKLLNQQKS